MVTKDILVIPEKLCILFVQVLLMPVLFRQEILKNLELNGINCTSVQVYGMKTFREKSMFKKYFWSSLEFKLFVHLIEE